jgi:quinol monooxygenase YgiN
MDKKLAVATFFAKPGSQEILREWILKTATASRKELGVEKYLINIIDENLGHFLLVGVYSSDDAFNEHVNSVHVQSFLNAVPDLVEDNITYIATPLVNLTDPKSSIGPI